VADVVENAEGSNEAVKSREVVPNRYRPSRPAGVGEQGTWARVAQELLGGPLTCRSRWATTAEQSDKQSEAGAAGVGVPQ
jgi:hypothetical protein